MSRPMSVAHLTAIQLDPPAFIRAAADAGFASVGLRLLRVTDTSPGYPLMDDPVALRETRAALAATGLTVSDIEFIKITPDIEIADLLPMFDAGAALGAAHVITAPYDPDLSRLSDRLGALAEAAKARGLGTVLEFFPWTSVPDLDTCCTVVDGAGPDVGVLVDTLHFDRSHSSLTQLAALPAHRVPFVHVCDAPVLPSYTTEELLFTAREARLPPGRGQIDLKAILSALPKDVPVALEVPTEGAFSATDQVAALHRLKADADAFFHSISGA